MPSNKVGLLLILLLSVCNGPSVALMQMISIDYGAITNITSRIFIAAMLFNIYLLFRKLRYPRELKYWYHALVASFLSCTIPYAIFAYGLGKILTSTASLTVGFLPIITAILSHYLVKNEKLNSIKIIGISLGFLGIAELVMPSLKNNNGNSNTIALILTICAPISYAIGIIYVKKYLAKIHDAVAISMKMSCAAIYLVPLALIVEQPWQIVPGTKSISAMLFLGVISTTLSFILFYKINRKYGPTYLSLTAYLQPITGILTGVMVLQEQLTIEFIYAVILILVALSVINYGSQKQQPQTLET